MSRNGCTKVMKETEGIAREDASLGLCRFIERSALFMICSSTAAGTLQAQGTAQGTSFPCEANALGYAVLEAHSTSRRLVLRVRGLNHIDAPMNLVLRSAHTQTSLRSLRKLDCGARVSKDGHKRDRASGHPSRRSARILRGSRASTRAPQDDGARRAPQDEAFETAHRKSAAADLRT